MTSVLSTSCKFLGIPKKKAALLVTQMMSLCELDKHILLPSRCVSACSFMSDSATHGLQPTRLLCSWDFPSKNTGVGCHFLLQEIFPTQGQNPSLLHLLYCQAVSLPLHHLGSYIYTPQYIWHHKQSTALQVMSRADSIPHSFSHCPYLLNRLPSNCMQWP